MGLVLLGPFRFWTEPIIFRSIKVIKAIIIRVGTLTRVNCHKFSYNKNKTCVGFRVKLKLLIRQKGIIFILKFYIYKVLFLPSSVFYL